MSNDDVLEQNGRDESSSVDIVELLAAANSRVFDDQNGLTDKNKNFEKVSSFFDLIKSSNNEDANSAEQDQSSEIAADESLDEEIVGLRIASLDGAADNKEIDIENLESNEDKLAFEDLQTGEDINEPEIDNSDTPLEEEMSSENFEPLDVIEQSRETVEKLKSQDKAETDQVEETSEEYNLGYQDALNEFEKTLDAEKKAISNFGSTLLSIRDDASKIIEELIKEKLAEISNEFLGKQVSEFPKDFLSHIENISESIVSSTSEIIVELNEIDAAALKTNIKLEQLAFKIKEVTDLGRAEFRIIVGKSGYEQKIAD
ncbi:MAG: hypothetical protein L7U86_02360 [Rhodobacteraceae bacterium]|nr:hypothetical protein [Paracoccaceae bacterium]